MIASVSHPLPVFAADSTTIRDRPKTRLRRDSSDRAVLDDSGVGWPISASASEAVKAIAEIGSSACLTR